MWSAIVFLSSLVSLACGHGRVLEPPSRSSAWRFDFPTPADYDDDGANCGGFAVQHASNGGKCGICGDAYSIPPPRPHEIGGMYGQGVITAHYLPGSIISTTVDLTTSHRGFWEFKLCPDPESTDQRCFDRHVLELESGGTKYYPNQGSTKYNIAYKLPAGLVCDHCVLQWRYTAGNNWGVCENGTQGLGCGAQEQFGACSDVSISKSKQLRDMPDNMDNEIPYPLFYYLKNGYFDAQQGILHLLRNPPPKQKTQPNQVTKTQPVQPQVNKQTLTTIQNQIKTPQTQSQTNIHQQQSTQQQNQQQSNQYKSVKQQTQLNQLQQSAKQHLQSQPQQSVNQKQLSNQQKHSAKQQQLQLHQPQHQHQNQLVKQHHSGKQQKKSNQHKSAKQQLLSAKQQTSPQNYNTINHNHYNSQSQSNQSYHQSKLKRHKIKGKHPQRIRNKKKPRKSARIKKLNNKRKHKNKGKPRKRKKKLPYEEFPRRIRVGTW